METLDLKKEFGTVVKRRRVRLGLSQEALAERADLHRTYVTDVERGTRNLSLESISKLARALDVSIGALFSTAARTTPTGGPGQPAEAHRMVDLLLVEDDPKDVELTLAAFKEAKLTNPIQVIRDGAAALDFLFDRLKGGRRRTKPRPQVVLLDLQLPKVHGLEVLRRIKGDPHTRKIKVVVLSASHRSEHIDKALRLGADGYIIKPVAFQNFSAMMPRLDFHWTLLQGRPAISV